jgi:hypothetical protein
MYACLLHHNGESRLHRNMTTSPDAFLKALAPSRDALVVAVACLLPWYWLAALCAREAMTFVLGPALSMKAMHGGKAKNDTIDSQTIAVLLRGGLRPQASVSPAERRATRALVRRRMPLMRQRAALVAHGQNTNSQYHWPAIGQQIASKAKRHGGAERCSAPAGPKRIAVALALLDY